MELIAHRLSGVLRAGVRPAKLVPHVALLDLLERVPLPAEFVQEEGSDPYLRALSLASVILTAVESLGDGPTGRATQALFGLTADTRGRPLKDRRRLAADELGVMSSTFRKYYEDDILWDVAVQLWAISRRSAAS